MAASRRSLRITVPATAAATVAVALLAGAAVLHVTLQAQLERGVRNTAALRAQDVAALAQTGQLPRTLSFPGEERSVLQVLDAGGAVVASTGNIEGEKRLAAASSGAQRSYVTEDLPIGSGERFALAVLGTDTPSGRHTIVSAESLDRVDATLATVRRAFLLGVPALVLLVGTLARRGVGRSLRPVEQIRSDVAEITALDLHQRVAEPGGDDEVARLAATMNRMLDRLDDASQRQRQFVADASHELRSPLASLRAQLEVGLSRDNRTDWPHRAASALEDALRLEALIDDLLVLARLDASGPEQHSLCDVADIAREEVRSARSLGVPVTLLVSSANDTHVSGSAQQLSRAVRNVLDNARRHARSQVRVLVRGSTDAVTVEVEDDGSGIPATDRTRVLERFVRLDEARARDEGGSGLGLAITLEILRSHGGSVQVLAGRSGALVRLTLPAAQDGSTPRPRTRG